MLQEKVLAYFERNKGKSVTGGQMARDLGVTRTAVWKAVHALMDKGHKIQTLPGSGYVMSDESDGLSAEQIHMHLKTAAFGRELIILETVDSTNSYLKSMKAEKLSEGYVVIANEQTAGRGRRGRLFYSREGEGIYMSLLLKPDILLGEVTMLTICAALATAEAIASVTGVETDIKWVNDIFCRGKKICGILTEGSLSAELQSLEYVVVGIGLNTGLVDAAVKDIAGSIYDMTGTKGIRNQLIAEILNRFEVIYRRLCENKREEIMEAYRKRLFIIGRKVEVLESKTSYTAVVMGVDDTGRLLVKNDNGEVRKLNSGEVSLSNYI